MALFLPGPDDPHFVFRGHPGIDGKGLDLLLQGLLGEKIQARAVDGLVPRTKQVQVPGNGHRGVLVVPGDHHRPDPGRGAPLHRCPYLRPGRVHHADEPHEDQLPLQLLGLQGLGRPALVALGHRQHPQGLGGQVAAHSKDAAAVGLGHGPGPLGALYLGTTGEHRLRRSLHRNEGPSGGQAVAGGHPLADRIKGGLSLAGHVPLQLGLFQSLPGGHLGNGGLCGVPHIAPGSLLGIPAEGAQGQGLSPQTGAGGPDL